MTTTGTRIEDLLRDLAPQVLGAIMRRFRDFDAAEDAVQEALLAAALQWPDAGVPENPRGWLIQVAFRRMADYVRSEQARRRREELALLLEPPDWQIAFAPDAGPPADRDDTLVLLFMCCHPALTTASATALTLRAVGGLTTAEIARAFMVPEATMAQRISRAKQGIKTSGIPFRMPATGEWAPRLNAVLHVLYLIFNEGYTSSAGPHLLRRDLSNEAIRLTRMLHRSLPDSGARAGAARAGAAGTAGAGTATAGTATAGAAAAGTAAVGLAAAQGRDAAPGAAAPGAAVPGAAASGAGASGIAAAEVAGLLALMLLTDARRPARVGPDGELIPLAEQDRTRWDRRAIDEGIALISDTLPRGACGPYQLQAAIAAVHDEAVRAEETDWPQILALYGLLERMADNPMVTLNQAIATAMVHGPAAGLERLQVLDGEGRLTGHHRLHAVRAHLLEMAGDREGALAEYRTAAFRTDSVPERRYLLTRAARLTEDQP